MHIQRAESILLGYRRKNWHLIEPSDQEYLIAAQVFADHQSSIGCPIEEISLMETPISDNSNTLRQSWHNAISSVAAQKVWAAKEILKNNNDRPHG